MLTDDIDEAFTLTKHLVLMNFIQGHRKLDLNLLITFSCKLSAEFQ